MTSSCPLTMGDEDCKEAGGEICLPSLLVDLTGVVEDMAYTYEERIGII